MICVQKERQTNRQDRQAHGETVLPFQGRVISSLHCGDVDNKKQTPTSGSVTIVSDDAV